MSGFSGLVLATNWGLPFGDYPTLLEWLLLFEGVVLLTALLFWVAARLITRSDPRDPMVRFYRVFWRAMFRISVPPPAAVTEPSTRGFRVNLPDPASIDAPDLGTIESVAPRLSEDNEAEAAAASAMTISTRRSATRDEPSPGDSESSAEKGATAEPARKLATLDVRIVPLCDADEVVGLVAGELVIRVTRAADDWQVNGTVLDMVRQRLRVESYQVTLIKGHNRVRKTLQVAGLDAAEIEQRLIGG